MTLSGKQKRAIMATGRAGGAIVVEPAGAGKWRVLRHDRGSILEEQVFSTRAMRGMAHTGWRVFVYHAESQTTEAWQGGE